jgi:hypothetical protein
MNYKEATAATVHAIEQQQHGEQYAQRPPVQ